MEQNKKYYIYIIECENNRLYTGITTDYKRRFLEHKDEEIKNKGAKFTKAFKPQKIVAIWATDGRSNALKLEYGIKHLQKEEKNNLIYENDYFYKYFADKFNIIDYKRINWR